MNPGYPLTGMPVFKTGAIDHSATLPIFSFAEVPPVGLEPTTIRLKVCCSNQLSYRGLCFLFLAKEYHLSERQEASVLFYLVNLSGHSNEIVDTTAKLKDKTDDRGELSARHSFAMLINPAVSISANLEECVAVAPLDVRARLQLR